MIISLNGSRGFASLVVALFAMPTLLAQGPAPLPTEKPAESRPVENASGAVPDVGVTHADFEATLIDVEAKAKARAASVQVAVRTLRLTDADATTGQSAPGEGHLHYQLDDGPVIATTSTKLAFHELAPGNHVIRVTLAGNDHQPISKPRTLAVTIPGP